ncbi:MAG: flagellin [Lachnospiraceae bacterium]|nr:flagellin [Lachnospiraceae bacterium]
MKVNNNISAVITNNQLLRTEDSLAKSMERLSSGLKINHSKDNPSGMAISNKMQAQINGLDQASRNSADGSSVLETADGALNELENMLQRMRELCVQAANDTNSQSDKRAIQDEIDKLKEEVDRISSTTEFNTKSLLNGSLDKRVYADNVSRVQVSEKVESGAYSFTITQCAQPANIASNNVSLPVSPATLENSGTVNINGSAVELTAGMTDQEVYEALRGAAEIGEVKASWSGPGGVVVYDTTAYGAEATINITVSNNALAEELGLNTVNGITQYGRDAQVTMDKTNSAFKDHPYATVKYEGNKLTFTDAGGFKISCLLDAGVDKDNDPYHTGADDPDKGKVTLNVTDLGPMDLQIGANEHQQMTVKIPATDTKSLYIDDLDVTTVNGAPRGISKMDEAIAQINQIRASLGAYTNRLESAVSSLDQTSENMNAAISRISDVDMALEMTEYTRLNVLTQASTSALSQANELPQMALQLLG